MTKKSDSPKKVKKTSKRNKAKSKRHFKFKSPEIPDPTEQEEEILNELRDIFELSDDASRAVARFEAVDLFPRYKDGDASEEEFDVNNFHRICESLGNITLLKKLIHIFGLEDYESEIISLSIRQLFSDPRKGGGSSTGQQVFRGDDESYLEYNTRNQPD